MRYDVAIVGAGPAGSSAAWFLSGSGMKVAVIERLSERFGAYHSICGGGVSRKGCSRIPLKEDEILNEVEGIRLLWPGGVATTVKAKGYILDRAKLSNRLLEESGADVIRGSVKDVWPLGGECVTALADGRTVHSRYVVGADGAFSAVRRAVFRTAPGTMTAMEEYLAEGPPGNILEFEVGQRFGGAYRWTFPCGSGRTVGSVMGALPSDTGKWLGHRFIPCGCVPEIVRGNVMLIGDAAGFPNPLTYGGLRAAFESAWEAAAAIRRGDLQSYVSWQKKSKLFDPRFSDLHDRIASMTDGNFAELSKPMNHRSLFANGLLTVVRNPRVLGVCMTCLAAIRYGW